MKIKYVGLKQFEDAFNGMTGVTWGPGVEHDIGDDVAARMLNHPDVFALAGAAVKEPESLSLADVATVKTADDPVAEDAPADPAQEDQPHKPQLVMQTEEGALVLDFLDKETLKQLAKEANIAVGNSGPDKIRQKLAEAFPVKD